MNSKNKKIALIVVMILASLFGIVAIMHSCGTGYFLDPRSITTVTPTPNPTANYVPYAVSWSSGVDFTQGEFNGVTVSENGDQIELAVGGSQEFTPTQICVAAAGANAIYLHNLEDPNQYIRVPSAGALPVFDDARNANPSRTAIDKDGNCWVGGRGNGGVYKISKEGVIKGKVQITNSGVNGNSNSRALAIDKNGFVWVGNYGDGRVYKIGPGEDMDGNLTILANYPTTDYVNKPVTPTTMFPSTSDITKPGPYGAAVDSVGNLWIAGYEDNDLSPGYISKIDTTTGAVQCTMRTNVYGIVIGKNNFPWVGAYDGGTLSKIKTDCSGFEFIISIRNWTISMNDGGSWTPENGTTEITTTSSLTRGVGLDTDDNIWVADSQYNYVYKFDDNGNYMGKVTTKGTTPIGVSGDPTKDVNNVPLGRIWAVNQSGSVARIMGKTIEPLGTNSSLAETFASGSGPYSYSDMVGFGLFTTVLKDSGSWSVKFDSGYDNPQWTSVTWHSKVNEFTHVAIRVRAAATEAELVDPLSYSSEFQTSPADLTTLGLNGRWIQVEITFWTTDGRYSPILDDFSINFSLPTG